MPGHRKSSAPPPSQTVEVPRPGKGSGQLKDIAGSVSDAFNNIVSNQAISSLWVANSNQTARDTQYQAAIAAMMGIKPADELEGMLVSSTASGDAQRRNGVLSPRDDRRADL